MGGNDGDPSFRWRNSLSSIIVTWNCREYIDDCLDSLFLNGPDQHQVIVVDNGSVDGTVKHLEQYSDIELIKNQKNMGLGYATCQAEKHVKHDLVLVSNPDILFTGLPELLDFAEKNPQVECMMPQLRSSQVGAYRGPPVHWHRFPHFLSFSLGVQLDKHLGKFLTKHCLAIDNSSPDEHRRILKDDKYVYGVSCMLLRRSLTKRIGGIYQPSYRWAWADADFGMRLGKYHARGQGVPESIMDHHGGYASQKLSDDARVFLASNGQKQWEKDWGHSSRYFLAQFIDTIFVSAWKRRLPMAKVMLLKGWLS